MILDFRKPPGAVIGDGWRRAARRSKLIALQRRILAQARDDLVVLTWRATGAATVSVVIPVVPFVRYWAKLRKRNRSELEAVLAQLPPWEAVSESGWKCGADDEVHTDWWVGAGLDPADAYGFARNVPHREGESWEDYQVRVEQARTDWAAFERAEWELGSRLLGHMVDVRRNCAVLVPGKYTLGRVVHPKPGDRVPPGTIAVIPHAGPEYINALDASAIVTEVGGAMAHLAVVGLDRGKPIVRVLNALSLYPVGSFIRVDSEEAVVEFANP